eukprot:scaffold17568_cov90-Isochrysis_galbana.AAC.2
MSTPAKRSLPSSRIGSYTLSFRISGFTSSIGTPFIFIRPRPFLQYATATAVFLRPKVCTDSSLPASSAMVCGEQVQGRQVGTTASRRSSEARPGCTTAGAALTAQQRQAVLPLLGLVKRTKGRTKGLEISNRKKGERERCEMQDGEPGNMGLTAVEGVCRDSGWEGR